MLVEETSSFQSEMLSILLASTIISSSTSDESKKEKNKIERKEIFHILFSID
jgi:hypothetical protein